MNTSRNIRFFQSLAFRTSIFITSILFLGFLIFSAVFILSVQKNYTADILRDGKTFAQFSSQSIYDSYAQFYTHPREEDFINFKQNVSSILSLNTDIESIRLISINGKVLFDTEEFETGKYTGETERRIEDQETLNRIQQSQLTDRTISTKSGSKGTEIIAPLIEQFGGHVLSVQYTLSHQSLQKRMNEVYVQIAMVVIPITLLVILLSFLFAIRISHPIVDLTKAAEAIKMGRIGTITTIKSLDEIGALAEVFNAMSLRLKDYYSELEQEVRKRTTELETTQSQLKEANTTLKTKVEELEKMNSLMVGRELKKEELKSKPTE